MPRKRGRPPKYVIGRDGEPVVGLSREPKSGRYYATRTRPRVYLGTDLDSAIVRYRQWQARLNSEPAALLQLDTPAPGDPVRLPSLPEPKPPPADPSEFQAWLKSTKAYILPVPVPGRDTQVAIDKAKLYDWARSEILTNPRQFAERTGVPQIAWIDDIKPPPESLSLAQVAQLYFNRKRRITEHWRRKQGRYWDEFCEVVKAKTIREIEREDVIRYHDHVWNTADQAGLSPTFIQHRLTAVRTILKNALKNGRDQKQIRRVLDLCQIFETPKKNGVDPRPISRDDFRRLLEVSSLKWRAVFTLALNCAFYPSEVAAVKRSHIDRDAKTLVKDRGKTGVPRIAILWDRTLVAICEYEKAESHQSEYLFVSRSGLPYDGNHISRNFRRRRTEAGLDETVTFGMIRDGAYTAAIRGGADVNQAKMLAGHSVGISDCYLKRDPQMVTGACAAIEQAYFGEQQASAASA